MTDKELKAKIIAYIEKEQEGLMDANGNFEYLEHEGAYHALCNLEAFINSLPEDPVSEDLEEAAISYAATGEFLDNGKEMIDFQKEKSFKAGAQWQFEHQWISVKDRLPTEEFDDGYTFVFVKVDVDEDTYRLETDYIRNRKWELHPNENITHWMPIPPIPNKED